MTTALPPLAAKPEIADRGTVRLGSGSITSSGNEPGGECGNGFLSYLMLLEALVAEHKPLGPTEEHLVEELAGVMWRKRHLRLAERAAHHRALKRASDPYQHTAEAALIGVSGNVEADCIGDAIRATEQQTPEDRADLEDDQAMTEKALRIWARPSSSALSPRLGRIAR